MVVKILLSFLIFIKFQILLAQNHCYNCDSTRDCLDNFRQSVCENEVDSEYLGCYHLEINDRIIRGCASNLTQEQFEDCQKGEFCKICQDDYCNSKRNFQKCFTCNSADDPSCANLQSSLIDKTCDDYLDVCKVYVKPNMTTHRGCSKEMPQENIACHSQAVNCKVCSENNCNGDIFPLNRLACIHGTTECYEENEKCFNEQIGESFPCEIYNFRDSCFLYLNENKTATRGCLSDSIFNEFCTLNPSKCKTCQTSNCNYESVIKRPKLSCTKCDGVECAWNFEESEALPCETHVYFHEEESCFSFAVNEKRVIRGCTLDSNLCKINNCTICLENGCNSESYLTQSCFKCTSNDDRKCFDDLASVEKFSCGHVSYEDRGCYAVQDENGVVQRGCAGELTIEGKLKCLSPNSTCFLCSNGDDCNNFLFNSAKVLILNKVLLILLLINF